MYGLYVVGVWFVCGLYVLDVGFIGYLFKAWRGAGVEVLWR